MKHIPLTQGKFAIVDDKDFEWLSQWKWQLSAGGYAVRRAGINGKDKWVRMHRLIANTPDDFLTDHINCDTLDNRSINLRICDKYQNARNKEVTKTNTSGWKGVTKEGRGWRARISIGRKPTHLGYYDTPEEAARAYDAAAKKLFGEFAKLNF